VTRALVLLSFAAACAAPQAPVGVDVGETASTRSATPAPTGTTSGALRKTPRAVSRSRATSPAHDQAPRASRSRGPALPTGTGTLINSTAYCETGLMANGHRTYRGAVAANRYPLGTRLRVSDSPYGPGIFRVADRIGHGSELDFAMPGDCGGARAWGRRDVRAAALS
jgi:hypothetical protein